MMTTRAPSTAAAAQTRGCSSGISPVFQYFCDLDALWGIIIVGMAGLGLVLTLIYSLCFSANIKIYMRHQRNRYSALFYFVLVGIFLLFSFSLSFVVQPTLIVCILRRVGIGMAWTITLAPLAVSITRTWRMSYLDEVRCCWLTSAVGCFICVEIIILVEWNILKIPQPIISIDELTRCETNEYDLPLSLIFNAFLLVLFFISSVVSCCKRDDHHISANHKVSSFSISSIVTSILLLLITIGWACMISFGNRDLNKEKEWSDPTTAMFMVVSGLVILLVMFSPIIYSMMKLRRDNLGIDDDDDRSRSCYSMNEFGRARNENAMAMSDLSFSKPIPAKRNHVDRCRVGAPTNGRLNPTLQLDEEDIWRNEAMNV